MQENLAYLLYAVQESRTYALHTLQTSDEGQNDEMWMLDNGSKGNLLLPVQSEFLKIPCLGIRKL